VCVRGGRLNVGNGRLGEGVEPRSIGGIQLPEGVRKGRHRELNAVGRERLELEVRLVDLEHGPGDQRLSDGLEVTGDEAVDGAAASRRVCHNFDAQSLQPVLQALSVKALAPQVGRQHPGVAIRCGNDGVAAEKGFPHVPTRDARGWQFGCGRGAFGG
jgi:hypothetical protein